MANDFVRQLGAKLDQFASDLNQAGDVESISAGLKGERQRGSIAQQFSGENRLRPGRVGVSLGPRR